MKFKKLICSVLSATMIMSNVTIIMAETTQETDSLWNYRLIEEGSEHLYDDFPFAVNKSMKQNMGMDLHFQYLKNIDADDEVTVRISDISDNSVKVEKELSVDDRVVHYNNIPNEETYLVEISENIDGETNSYTRYIETKFIEADFPVNMTLGNTTIEQNNGEEFDCVMYRKVSEQTTDISGVAQTYPINSVAANELNNFYQTLDENCYYELQLNLKNSNLIDTHFQGFISTYENGGESGIFTRGYEIRNTIESISTFSNLSTADFIDSGTCPDEYINMARDYQFYKNDYFDLEYPDAIVYRYIPPETGEYTFEVIGNVDVFIQIFTKTNGVFDSTSIMDRTGNKAGLVQLVNEDYIIEYYVVLTYKDGDETEGAFRVIREDYHTIDPEPNYFDQMRDITATGTFSDPDNISHYLNYSGDVDIYAYDVNAGVGYIDFKKTDINDEPELYVGVYCICTSETEVNYNIWCEGEMPANDPNIPTAINFSDDKYYFEIFQRKGSMPEYSTENDEYYADTRCKYDFSFYDPMRKDAIEASTERGYDNSPYYAKEITTEGYHSTDHTLSKSDSDYFKFTTGANGGNITIKVDKYESPYLYIPHLYDSDDVTIEVDEENGRVSWWGETDLATYITENDNENNPKTNILTYNNLEPNHLYYIKIARPNSTSYDAYYKYKLDIDFTMSEVNVPTAILENNVTLTHTVGNDISSTDSLLSTVMESLTCKIDDVTVDDSEAVDDVELYYNDSLLTADVVNALSAGTYSITAKYQDAAATGGTITLTVSEAVADDIVQIENITKVSSQALYVLDWAAAAKMIADVRLAREGHNTSNLAITQIGVSIIGANAASSRGTIDNTVSAANYVYNNVTGSTSTFNFIASSMAASQAASQIYAQIQSGNAVILQLSTEETPTDMSLARYIIVCGVNATKEQFYIIDPITSATGVEIVDQTLILNGGYGGNANMKFSGTVIDFSF